MKGHENNYSQNSSLESNVLRSYHTFYKFILARIRNIFDGEIYDENWIRASLEHLLTGQLYQVLINFKSEKDEFLYDRCIRLSQWVRPEDLGIIHTEIDDAFSKDNLKRLYLARTPTQKLSILVGPFLKQDGLTADTIVPLLIFKIIKECPPHFSSQLQFVMNYWSSTSFDVSLVEYCLTSYLAAIAWIECAEPKTFGISADEFNKNCLIESRTNSLLWKKRQNENHFQRGKIVINYDKSLPEIISSFKEKALCSMERLQGFFGEAEVIVKQALHNENDLTQSKQFSL